ncbi:glycoside hydrolase family 5 protein [Pedobacter sp. G11]|uniref:glycoside hydrolase family 5 protein n=1 Tax=Pedobacter sp. G11 TaxID=2482728 RepID=UPI00143DF274|nr:glycoside hydrolase family 5 protein [Pedobacter sp. G11]
MKSTIYLISLLVLTSFSCKGNETTAPDQMQEQVSPAKKSNAFTVNGRLKLSGTNMVNQKGIPVQLRGMSTHGLQYRGNCYSEQSLNVLMNDWGADILRISMYVQEGGYEKDPVKFTAFVDDLVEKCFKEGIYALIDFHMLDPGDPNYNTDRAKVFFEHVSKKHSAKGNVIYEICNEPNNKQLDVTWAVIKRYADQIVPIIRKNDPQSIVIVGTPEYASRPDLVIGNKLAFENIMYTMHFYAAENFQSNHQGRRMGYVAKAIENGIPVFVTEFGTQNGWGDGENDFDMSAKWLKFLADHKISWCNWNYSDSPLSGAVWKTGTCPNGPWTDDNLKESGKWIKQNLISPVDEWSKTP